MEEVMTDFQFRAIIKMVLEILKSSKDIQEAVNKVSNLLEKDEK